MGTSGALQTDAADQMFRTNKLQNIATSLFQLMLKFFGLLCLSERRVDEKVREMMLFVLV